MFEKIRPRSLIFNDKTITPYSNYTHSQLINYSRRISVVQALRDLRRI